MALAERQNPNIDTALEALTDTRLSIEDRAGAYAVIHQVQLRLNRALRKVKDDLIVYMKSNDLKALGPLSVKSTPFDVEWPCNQEANWTDATTQDTFRDILLPIAPEYVRLVPEHYEIRNRRAGQGRPHGRPAGAASPPRDQGPRLAYRGWQATQHRSEGSQVTADRIPMAARLSKIMGEIGRIEKRGEIRSQGSGPSYNFARDTDVMDAVVPRMVEEGIIMVPESVELLSIGPNMRETQMIANIKMAWHVTDGIDSIRFETLGQGQDSGDKALPKAQSNARKYAFFLLFHIVTGDDPDQSVSESGGRARRSQPGQGAQSKPVSGPVPAPAYRRTDLVAVMRAKALDYKAVEDYATLIGIPTDERPMSDASMDRLIAALEGHGTVQPLELPLQAPEPPQEPPKPGSDEYKALPVFERSSAKAYWSEKEALV